MRPVGGNYMITTSFKCSERGFALPTVRSGLLRPALFKLIALLGFVLAGTAHAENVLEDITYAAQPGGKVDVTLKFSGPVASPQIFATETPPRIAIDLADTRNGMSQRRIEVGAGATSGISAIEAAGRTVVPGLVDAHVHFQPSMQAQLLESGVTSVRDLGNGIDGTGSGRPEAIVAGDFTSARAAVRQLVESGADVIAIGPRLTPPILAIVVQESAARGVPVAADLGLTTAIEAASFGVTSIEHLSGIVEAAAALSGPAPRFRGRSEEAWIASERDWTAVPQESLARVAHALLDRGITLVPTLVRQEIRLRAGGAAPEAQTALAVQQRFVRDYAQMGGRVAAGTDAGTPSVVPGASLLRELQLYVEGGMAPAAALRTATADAAALLGSSSRAGTITIGKDADLVIVDGDPLRDISALRRVISVVRRGAIVKSSD